MNRDLCLLMRNTKRLSILALTALLLLLYFPSSAQIQITYPSEASDVVTCDGDSTFEVRFDVVTPFTSATVEIGMPTGVSYIPGSVMIDAGNSTAGYNIADLSTANPSHPIFSLTLPAGGVMPLDIIRFKLARKASCDALDAVQASGSVSVKDSVFFLSDVGNEDETSTNNSYEILFPEIGTGNIQNLVLPDFTDTCRRVRIINGGLGHVSSVQQEVIVGTSLDNYRLYYKKGTPDEALLTPSSTIPGTMGGPDTFIYTIDLNAAPFLGTVTGQNSDGDNLFENGEVIRLDECFNVTECAQQTSFTTHTTYWECANSGAGECRRQTPPRTGSAGILSANPLVTAKKSGTIPNCSDGVARGKVRIGYYSSNGLPFKQRALTIQRSSSSVNAQHWGVDTNSVKITLSDGTPVTSSFDPTWTGINRSTQLENSCLGGTPSSFYKNARYALDSNLVVPIGDTLFLEFEYVTCCGSETACDGAGAYYIFGYLYPNNICDVPYNYRRVTWFPYGGATNVRYLTEAYGLLVNSPSTISDTSGVGGANCVPFEYNYSDLDLAFSRADSFSNDEAFLEVKTVFPVGFSYTMGSTVASNSNGPVTPYYTDWDPVTRTLTERFLRGDIYTSNSYISSTTVKRFSYGFDACMDCGPRQAAGLGQTAVFNQELGYQMFPSCDNCFHVFECNDVPIIALCPGPCPDGGGIMTAYTGGRINTCEADYDENGVADFPAQKAHIDSIDRKQIMVGDTICYNAAMRAVGGLESNPDDTWNAGRFRTKMPRGDFFDIISATIVIQDRDPISNAIIGTYTVNNAEGLFTKTVVNTVDANFEVDISSALGAPVPGSYVIGEEDSIGVLACYRWTERDGQYYDHFNRTTTRPNQDLVVDDIITTFNVTIDNFATEHRCNFIPGRVLLHGQYTWNYVANGTSTTGGCASYDSYAITGGYTGSASFLSFPNESRLLGVSDRVQLMKKPGTTLTYAYIRYRHVNFSTNPTFAVPLTDVVETDTSYIIYPKQYLEQYGGTLTLADYSSVYYTYFRLQNDCEANTGDRRITMITDFSLLKKDSSDISYRSTFTGGHDALPTQFGHVQTPITASTTEEFVTFKLQSQLNRTANCVFMEFISPSGFVDLENIHDNNAGMDLTYNAALDIYEAGPQSSAAISNYDITVKQNRCAPDSFQLVVGYACTGCPTSADDYDMCDFDTLTYYIIAEGAALQINLLDEPQGPQELCEPIKYEVQLTSSGTGDLVDPRLFVDLPPGYEIDSMILTYPPGSNPIMVTGMGADPIIVSLSDHPMIDGFLPGTSTDPTDSVRQANLQVYGNTNCDFVASSAFGFAGFGQNPCGGFAPGTFNRVISNDLTINGVTNPYGADINISPVADVVDCETFTVSSEMTMFLIDPLNSVTFTNDTLTVEIPAGLTYEGNYNCTSVVPANCMTFVSHTVNPDGSSVVLFKIPAGIPIAPDPAVFSWDFDLSGNVDLACANLLVLNMFATTEIGPVPCTTEPTGQCDLIAVGTGQGDAEIAVDKQNVGIGTNTFKVVYNTTDGSFFYDADVRIDKDLAVGETINVEYYCLDAADMRVEPAILTEQISGPVTAGATVSLTGTIPTGCDTMYGIRMLIPQDGIGANDNCICAADSADALDAGQCPVIDTIIFDPNILCNNTQIALTAVVVGDYASVQWSTTGSGALGGGSTLMANYTPSEADLDAASIRFCLDVTPLDSRCPPQQECKDISPLVMKPVGVDGERCGPGRVTLTAQSMDPDCDTYVWYTSPTAIVPSNTGAIFRPTISATTTYYVACKSLFDNCESNRVPVIATIHPEITGTATNGTLDCGAGADGMITVTASGGVASGTLEYSIDNGATWQPSNVFTGLSAGSYLIKVRNTGDVEGCELDLVTTLEPYECDVTVPNPPRK